VALQENSLGLLGGLDLKAWIVVSLCAVFIILTGFFTHGESKEKKPPTEGFVAAFGSARLMGVDEYMTNVDHYQGPVNIKGVVSVVSAKYKMIGLIDTGEFEDCKVVTCARLTLPAYWTGEMLEVKDTVVVEGEAKQKNKRFVFVARTLKKARSSREGLP
jgi:hypothetical protein